MSQTRTNIVMDDKFVREALKLTGSKSKREVVELALQRLVQSLKQRRLLELYGADGLDPNYDYKAARGD